MDAAGHSSQRLLLIAGTQDGLFIYERVRDSAGWRQTGPFLKQLDVSHAKLDPRDGRTIYAAATGNGSTAVYRSLDQGTTWEMAGKSVDVHQVWHVEPGHNSQPGRVYAGTMTAGLFVSDDRGDSWTALDEGSPAVRSLSC